MAVPDTWRMSNACNSGQKGTVNYLAALSYVTNPSTEQKPRRLIQNQAGIKPEDRQPVYNWCILKATQLDYALLVGRSVADRIFLELATYAS